MFTGIFKVTLRGWKLDVLQSALCGVLVALCIEPFKLSVIIFFAYVPLLFVLERTRSFWKLLLYAWIAVFIQTLISFQWIHLVSREFGNLSWFTSLMILLAFALFTNFYLQIFTVLYYLAHRISKNSTSRIFYFIVVPSIFMLGEVLDPRIFNWYAGNLLSSFKYMVQFADVLGVESLSFAIMVVNVAVFLIIKKKKWLFNSIVIVTPLIFLSVYGYYDYKNVKGFQDTCPKIKVGVIQANIGNPWQLSVAEALRLTAEFNEDRRSLHSELIYKKYESMTEKLLSDNRDIDLIVWPETAFPGYYIDGNPMMHRHKEMVKKLGLPFLIGGYYLEDGSRNGRYYNSAILITPEGRVDFYHKTKLLPFGEYIPLSHTFPFLKNVVPEVGDFSRGAGPATLDLPVDGLELRFAPTICYEMLKSPYVREMVKKDANILLNLSNDSWFGSIEPYQHLRLTVMRAIEYRRPIVRSTNTGVTSLIDMTGTIITKSSIHDEESFVFDVPICDHRYRTFYTVAGFMFAPLVALISLLSLLYLRGLRLRRRR